MKIITLTLLLSLYSLVGFSQTNITKVQYIRLGNNTYNNVGKDAGGSTTVKAMEDKVPMSFIVATDLPTGTEVTLFAYGSRVNGNDPLMRKSVTYYTKGTVAGGKISFDTTCPVDFSTTSEENRYIIHVSICMNVTTQIAQADFVIVK